MKILKVWVNKMREPEACNIEYCGYKEPMTPEELEFEILGLETAIFEARKKISTLRQTAYLVEITMRDDNDNSNCK